MLGLLAGAAFLISDPGGEASIETALSAMVDAWRSGRIEDAGAEAERALDLIAASACPVRTDAAYAAFVAGVAAAASSEGDYGVFFWTASRVSELSDAPLPREQTDVIDAHLETPGRDSRKDAVFLRSPYFRISGAPEPCGTAIVSPADLEDVAADAAPVVAFFNTVTHDDLPRRHNLPQASSARLAESRGRSHSTESLYVYPQAAADRVEAAVSELDVGDSCASPESYSPFVFDPCAAVRIGAEDHSICLPPLDEARDAGAG